VNIDATTVLDDSQLLIELTPPYRADYEG